MNNQITLWKQFLSGGINGFILGIIIEICVFLYNLIKVGGNLDSLPPTVYFVLPLQLFFAVGMAKVVACKLFRICGQSIIGWQLVGLISIIPSYIIGEFRLLILTTFYGFEIRNAEFSLIASVIGLFVLLIFNFLYAIVIKAISKRTTKLK